MSQLRRELGEVEKARNEVSRASVVDSDTMIRKPRKRCVTCMSDALSGWQSWLALSKNMLWGRNFVTLVCPAFTVSCTPVMSASTPWPCRDDISWSTWRKLECTLDFPPLNGSMSVYFDEFSEFSPGSRCRKAVSTFEASQRPLAISSPSRWSTGIQ